MEAVQPTHEKKRERERERSYLFCALSAPAPLLTGKACARICFSGTLLPRKKRAKKMQGKAREEEASPSDVPTPSWVVRSVLLWTTRKVPIIHTEAGEVSQWSLPTLFSHTRRRGPSPNTVIIARINLSLVLLRPKNRGAFFLFSSDIRIGSETIRKEVGDKREIAFLHN